MFFIHISRSDDTALHSRGFIPRALQGFFLTLLSLIFSILAQGTLWQEDSMAQEEEIGKLVETFTLNQNSPSRTFFDGKLKVELVSSTADEYMKTIKIRIASQALKAEYGDEWQEHTFLEMLKGYVGSPMPEIPFKCAEGWLYYEKSDAVSVTLSLRTNPKMSTSSYNVLIMILKHWKKAIIIMSLIGLGFFLYYYTPLIWSFISIQHLAHAHALETGFPSSPVPIYLIKRLPIIIAFYFMLHFLFSYGWKGVVVAALIGISLQLYLNWHNPKQLQIYASIQGLTAIPDSRKRAFQGQVNGLPVALAVGGTFIRNSYYSGDYQSGGPGLYMSYMILEVTLKNPHWDGLVLLRDINLTDSWSADISLNRFPRIQEALAGISRLSKYSILRLEVRNGKLNTMKMFAPDTPAEVHLLVSLVTNVAQALDKSHR